jgi:hypothetical protein
MAALQPDRGRIALRLELVDLNRLRPHPDNPREMTEESIIKLAQEMEERGFRDPIEVCTANGLIVAGNRRYLAAKRLNLKRVPVIWHDDMTPEEGVAYLISNNRASEDGRWNRSLLADMLVNLEALGTSPATLGFEEKDIAKLFDLDRGAEEPVTDEEKAAADAEPGPYIEHGQMWEIGPCTFRVYDTLSKDQLRKAEATIVKLQKVIKAEAKLGDVPIKTYIAERALAAGVA